MLVYVQNNILDNVNLAHVANQFIDRQPQTNIQTFFSKLFILYVRFSEHLGTFHIFIFPIKCIERVTVAPFIK